MKDWVARGFPVRRKRSSLKGGADLIADAALPVMGAGVAVALHEFTAAALLLAIAGVLLFRPKFSSPRRRRQSARGGLTHAIKAARLPNGDRFIEGETA